MTPTKADILAGKPFSINWKGKLEGKYKYRVIEDIPVIVECELVESVEHDTFHAMVDYVSTTTIKAHTGLLGRVIKVSLRLTNCQLIEE